ncbi:MAG: RNA degradosome polyphosphate kinase, partial [Myxococcota bacterium]
MSLETDLFFNRELSWIAFNERVLSQAADPSLPLYQRVRFLSIAASNLDEFFMVRVAGLKRQVANGVLEAPPDGLSPGDQLEQIRVRVREMVARQDHIWTELLLPGLRAAGVTIHTADDLDGHQRSAARELFLRDIFPALTPIAVDPGHPFPHLRSGSLNQALALRRAGRTERRKLPQQLHAVVQVPSVLPRLVPVPPREGRAAYALLGQLIALFAEELFPGYVVEENAAFRVTRNWDLSIDEEEAEDLLSAMQEELRRRDRGAAVRLELASSASLGLEQLLCDALSLGAADVYRISSIVQLADMAQLAELDPRPEHHIEPHVPVIPRRVDDGEALFDVIRAGDILLHHPYESFDPVVRFVEEAAEDPRVL